MAELPKFSVSMPEGQVAEVDEVAAELVPPASRNSAIRYLVGLGLIEHRRRKQISNAVEQAAAAMDRDRMAV